MSDLTKSAHEPNFWGFFAKRVAEELSGSLDRESDGCKPIARDPAA